MMCMKDEPDTDARTGSESWRKTARFGFAMCGVSSLLILTPLALGLDDLAKYFMAAAFLSACLGTLCAVLAAIEWMQSRR